MRWLQLTSLNKIPFFLVSDLLLAVLSSVLLLARLFPVVARSLRDVRIKVFGVEVLAVDVDADAHHTQRAKGKILPTEGLDTQRKVSRTLSKQMAEQGLSP